MKNMSRLVVVAASLSALPLFAGCSSEADSSDGEVQGAEEALGGSGHFCPAPFTGGHSSSPHFMYSGAHAAMLAAGVSDGALIQTFGDAPASVGTHCPEPGVTYSDATDIDPGSNPCGRVHALRMNGFAAFYRTPPSFGFHIHAVYAGAPAMKSSLKNQLASFYARRNGLVSNTIETHCPITQTEIDAVRSVAAGHHSSGGCQPGGTYCGGDKVAGDPSTLYRCNSDGTASAISHCSAGCAVVSGSDDECHGSGDCSPGGSYCGGDKVSGNPSTLYRCTSGRSGTALRTCANGCSVNAGRDDSCR
ncbi:MAG: hypothetical protein ABIP39_11940 [Polyangiaceae bacterium]